MDRNLNILLLIAASVLLILSIYFTSERIVFLDNALHIIYSINTNEVGIMAGRWPIAIVRIPLWISIQLNLPLEYLLIIYSLSHIIFKLGFLFILSRFNSIKPLILGVITYFLVINQTFFWNVSELLPALFFVAIIYGVLKSKNHSINLSLTLITCFTVLAFFSHPQSLLAIGFISIYLFLADKKYYSLYPAMLVSLLYFIKKVIFPNWYDQMKMEGLNQNFDTFGFSIYTLPSFIQLTNWAFSEFLLITISIAITVPFLLFQKKILKALLFVSSTLLVLNLFVLSNPEEVALYYAEASMYLVSFFIGIVFVEDIYNSVNLKFIITSLSIIIVIAFMRIMFTSNYFTNRIEYINEIISKLENPKTAILQKNTNTSLLGMDWGLPFETLILSKINYPYKDKTIVTMDDRRTYSKDIMEKNILLNGIGGKYDIKHLNRYFNLLNETYIIDSIVIK